MTVLLVLENPDLWPGEIPGVQVISPKDYLTDPSFSLLRRARLYNLSASYKYQSLGYYVSLLALARGHAPVPSVGAIRDMKIPVILRLLNEDFEDQLQKSFARLKSTTFTLSIYFGRNLANRYSRLASQLFQIFQAPLLRADFVKKEGQWRLKGVNQIAAEDVPEDHWPFVIEAARAYFAPGRRTRRQKKPPKYSLAILYDERDPTRPSDPIGIEKFVRAGEQVGFDVDLISKKNFPRLPEYDALFIRETTSVDNHTYNFSRRAAKEGMVVVDDPDSILRCTNKVYQHELFERHRVPAPRTFVAHRQNLQKLKEILTFPCVLKRPDSSSSLEVHKASSAEEFCVVAKNLLSSSSLVVVQDFIATAFDWRVGVYDNEPLFICKYYMADGHWQIANWKASEQDRHGWVETIAVEDAPPALCRLALKACKPIGRGLYGVDIKESGKRFYVIEVNDNPNIENGLEDKVLGNALYETVMRGFFRRLEERK